MFKHMGFGYTQYKIVNSNGYDILTQDNIE